MKKINFVNGTTIDGASTFNQMQNNVEEVFNGEEAMGSIVVEDIKCKNEFNINKVLDKFNANYSIDGDNITITSTGAYANIRVFVDVEMGKEYTLSCSAINNQDTRTNINIYKTNGSDRYVEQYGYGTTPNFNLTFTPTENQIMIMFYANPTPDENTNTVNYNNIQLEKGSVATKHTENKKFGYISSYNVNGKYVKFDNGICIYTDANGNLALGYIETPTQTASTMSLRPDTTEDETTSLEESE